MSHDYLERIQRIVETFNHAALVAGFSQISVDTTHEKHSTLTARIGRFHPAMFTKAVAGTNYIYSRAPTPVEALEKVEAILSKPGKLFYDARKYDGGGDDGVWPPDVMWKIQPDGAPLEIPYDEAKVQTYFRRNPV